MSETIDAAQLLRIQAHANRLANHRLHAVLARLSRDEFHAPRTGFFPSLAATLNHVLAVDLYYVAALCADPDPRAEFMRFVAADDVAALAAAQRVSDVRLLAFCNGLDAAGVAAEVAMPRHGGRVQRDRAAHVLQHLFMHQTHHRGQAHAMLSSTAVEPPQLDEFLMPSEPHLRVPEMAALGWQESTVYGA
jgi:uncharacterized damage-inducible protein DinB